VEDEGSGSVTNWMTALKAGDAVAAQPLWERYFQRLVHLARGRFPILQKAGAIEDEEDAALSAFKSVCLGLTDGRYPNLADRDDLWRLLVLIASRKAVNQAERWGRQKRGGGALVRESDLEALGNGQESHGLDDLVGPDPTPEFLVTMDEECQRLMRLLEHPGLQLVEVATWKLEGFTEDEIAAKLGCSRRTVASRLKLIRTTWEQFL
jgi:DNA-directed RNA polymerase specialized sigma24 family protein